MASEATRRAFRDTCNTYMPQWKRWAIGTIVAGALTGFAVTREAIQSGLLALAAPFVIFLLTFVYHAIRAPLKLANEKQEEAHRAAMSDRSAAEAQEKQNTRRKLAGDFESRFRELLPSNDYLYAIDCDIEAENVFAAQPVRRGEFEATCRAAGKKLLGESGDQAVCAWLDFISKFDPEPRTLHGVSLMVPRDADRDLVGRSVQACIELAGEPDPCGSPGIQPDNPKPKTS